MPRRAGIEALGDSDTTISTATNYICSALAWRERKRRNEGEREGDGTGGRRRRGSIKMHSGCGSVSSRGLHAWFLA